MVESEKLVETGDHMTGKEAERDVDLENQEKDDTLEKEDRDHDQEKDDDVEHLVMDDRGHEVLTDMAIDDNLNDHLQAKAMADAEVEDRDPLASPEADRKVVPDDV